MMGREAGLNWHGRVTAAPMGVQQRGCWPGGNLLERGLLLSLTSRETPTRDLCCQPVEDSPPGLGARSTDPDEHSCSLSKVPWSLALFHSFYPRTLVGFAVRTALCQVPGSAWVYHG